MFHTVTNYQIMPGGWKVNTTNSGLNLKNTLFKLFLWGWGFHVEPVFFFIKDSVLTCSFMSSWYFRFTYLWARLKALHSESERSYLKPSFPMNLGSWVSRKVINIGLVTLPLDSGPKLVVGQWIALWSGLPGASSSRRKLCMFSYHRCHIYNTWKSI